MGRPDLTKTRTAEILDAFARCVARYGLEGSSLQKVAEEAGMQRSILRHYVGNREDLIVSLAKRVVSGYEEHLRAFIDSTTADDRGKQVLDYLFERDPSESTEGLLVVEALIAEGAVNPVVRESMSGYVERLVEVIGAQLRLIHPKAGRGACWSVASGLICLCFNDQSLRPLGLPPKYSKAARGCAERLLDSLQ